MTDFEEEMDYHSDSSDNEEQYSKLAEVVSELDSKKRVKAPLRKELTSEVSEFNLANTTLSSSNQINVKELTNVLEGSKKLKKIITSVKKVEEKVKPLPKPLEKIVHDKIERNIGFRLLKHKLGKWNSVVLANRVADHLTFPLNQESVSFPSSTDVFKKLKPSTPLEIEIAKILNKKDDEEEEEEEDEEEKEKMMEYPLTLQEMIERRKEMASIRAKQSYKIAKARRDKQIKSKKYHRMLKQAKLKMQMKEFEELRKTDPEAALQKLEEIDRARVEERASLKHRNTGKWARNLQVRAKYNNENRKILGEQLRLSREIAQKVKKPDSSDEEDEDEEVINDPSETSKTGDENPWAVDLTDEVKGFISGYKKFWEEKNKEQSKINENGQNSTTGNNQTKSVNVTNRKGKVKIVKPVNGEIKQVKNVKNSETVSTAETEEPENLNSQKTKENGYSKNNKVSSIVNDVKMSDCDSSIKSFHEAYQKVKNEDVKSCNEIHASSREEKSLNGKVRKRKPDANESSNLETESKIKARKSILDMDRLSGIWEVEEVNEDEESQNNEVIIDDLFDELDYSLRKEIDKKLKSVEIRFKKPKVFQKVKDESSDSEEDELPAKKFRGQIRRPDLDGELMETSGGEKEIRNRIEIPSRIVPEKSVPDEIDPNKFIQVKKPVALKTKLPDNITGGDEGIDDDDDDDDDEKEKQMTILEAFGDDDVAAEFREMKKAEEKSTQLEEVSKELPGWGQWGGEGVVLSKKRKRKTQRCKVNIPLPPRKDDKKDDMIIAEEENPKILDHLVKTVPYPFKSVNDFEASIRAPVGRDWVPESAHRKLIQPAVETKIGAIINPMSYDQLILEKTAMRCPFKGKTNKDKK